MAILTGGLLGSSRNKVGSIVTYRANGQDIARSLAANISNPRTESQQGQRVRLANLGNFYKANSAWMARYAFSRRPETWSVFNAFVSANIQGQTPFLTKGEAAQGVAIVAPYKITDGTIPSIVHSPYDGANGATDIYLGSGFEITQDTTIGQLSTAILENNNTISAGWQLSLIINYQQSTGDAYYILPRYYEITLAVGDTSLVTSRFPFEHISAMPDGAGNQTRLAYVGESGDPVAGYAFIWSNRKGGVVNVSSQYMQLTDDTLYSSYISPTQLTNAIDSYGGTSEAFLAPGYGSGGASDSDVVVPSSILRVSLNGTSANVGGYLGAYGSEQAGTLSVTFNRDIAADNVANVAIYWGSGENDSVSYTTGLTAVGSVLSVAIPAGSTPNPTMPISAINVTFTNGAILRASFRTSDEVQE